MNRKKEEKAIRGLLSDVVTPRPITCAPNLSLRGHGERVSRVSRYGSNIPDAQASMGVIPCSLLSKKLSFGLPPVRERSKAGALAERGTESMMPDGFRGIGEGNLAGSLFFHS